MLIFYTEYCTELTRSQWPNYILFYSTNYTEYKQRPPVHSQCIYHIALPNNLDVIRLQTTMEHVALTILCTVRAPKPARWISAVLHYSGRIV